MIKVAHDQADLDLVGEIYDASLDPDLWRGVLAAFAQRLGAASASLSFQNVNERVLSLAKFHGRDESYLRSYREYFIHRNPYLEVLPSYPDSLYLSQSLIPEDELVRSEFYQDWMRPQGIHFHAGSVIFRDEARLAVVDWQRPREAGPYSDRELAELARFEPHFRRALTINQKFWDLLSNSNAAIAVLDSLEIGVIFLNEHKEIVYFNPEAERLTRFGDGLVIKQHRVTTAVPEQTARLDSLLDGAVQTGAGLGVHPGGAMWVGLLVDRPYHVLVSPLRNRRNDLGLTGKRVCAAVFLSSPYQPYAVSAQSLRNYYGLTAAEANIVSELANGLPVSDIADKLELSKHTIRAHLRSIFAKTRTRRQSDLIKLVRSSPTSVIRDGVLQGPSLGGPLERRTVEDRRSTPRAGD